VWICNQCYNTNDCDIFLTLQELINKNKDMNLQFTVERCDDYRSGIQKLIEDIENKNITIEEAKHIKQIGFINFDEIDSRIQKVLYDIEE